MKVAYVLYDPRSGINLETIQILIQRRRKCHELVRYSVYSQEPGEVTSHFYIPNPILKGPLCRFRRKCPNLVPDSMLVLTD